MDILFSGLLEMGFGNISCFCNRRAPGNRLSRVKRRTEEKLRAIEIYSKLHSDYVNNLFKLGMFQPEKHKESPPIFSFYTVYTNLEEFENYNKENKHKETLVLTAKYR